ncbi:MAG: glycosyltransferase family 1 protein [Planctomycetes bacterium]|nr:glycosyltransferase family 1 protein [Planctomycetota bacterium]
MGIPGNKDILCFGGEDWWYQNRGHIDMQLMRRFAKQGTVLYVNSIVMQKPAVHQGRKFIKKLIRKTKSILTGLKKSDAGFWVYSPFTLPVHHIAWARPVNEMILRYQIRHVVHKLRLNDPIVWVACPAACDTAIRMKKSLLIYQRTDRLEEYPNVDHDIIRKYDQKLKACADLTIFVNRSLFDEETSQCKKALYLDHGVDFEMFTLAEKDPEKPMDISGIEEPIVGYFGELDDHKLDINFIEAVADLLPNFSFVFVGKSSPRLSPLARKKNIWMLGQKDYKQIPSYGKCFDVTIIPWRKNRWTEAANPIKLKEYLALGKPLVSTPVFTELQEYRNVVYEANTPKEFANSIEKALRENNDEQVMARRKMVEKSSWDSKAQLVLDELFKNKQSEA